MWGKKSLMTKKTFHINHSKERDKMKKNVMSFIMITIVLILMVSIGCSEKKKEMSPEESSIKRQKRQEEEKKMIVKSKIDLLCLKYEVESETIKNDLIEYLDTDYFSLLEKETNGKDEEITEELFHKIRLSRKLIDTEKLISMSKKYNVPIRKISGVVYDYKIWKELKDIDEELEDIHEELEQKSD